MKRPRREDLYKLGALALVAAIVLAAVGFWFFTRPTQLRVAVAPRDSVEEKLISAFSSALKESDINIGLRTQFYGDLKETATALQTGKTQLAIVRPDVELPSNGLTLAILREEALVFAAPAASKIADIADLSGRKLGLVDAREADRALIERVLARYELAEDDIEYVELTAQEMPAAVSSGKVDAIAFVAAAVSSEAGTLMRAFSKAAGNDIAVLPVEEAEALSLRYPAFTKVTIPAGAFGGRPKQPAEELTTIGVSYRLMAASTLDRGPASVLTENLFRMRSRLSQATATVNLMKAPEIDSATSAALPNHPGAVDYFEREQQTLFERYEDYVYLLAFFGGTIGSGIAWLGQRLARQRRERVDVVLDRLLDILRDIRSATTREQLDGLVRETDDLVTD
ncbi:MAG: TAXI family TRAP transporter solute-binding subunit, partial [Beijerinckiaceae bacterium]|nr:TAXI family TRAP transporter solute-binding subunit [Beijerinckiaceae bacterium]